MLGDLWGGDDKNTPPRWDNLLENTATKLHLYGKLEARNGRKMGHFCTLATSVSEAQQQANTIFNTLAAD